MGSGGAADTVTWVQVLAGVSPLVVALIAVSGVIGTIIFTNRRERTRQEHERQLAKDRQKHERLLKDAELADTHKTRHRDERREAYTAYMVACDRLHDGDYSQEAMAEFRKTVAVVWLVSSSEAVRKPAKELSDFVLVRQPREEQRGEGEANRRRIDADYGAVLRKLLNAAQEDLGISPVETPDSPRPLQDGERDG